MGCTSSICNLLYRRRKKEEGRRKKEEGRVKGKKMKGFQQLRKS